MITSKSNEQVKYILSLKEKKYRDMYSEFILEGVKLIDEISSGDNPPELIVYCKEILQNVNGGDILLAKLKQRKIKLFEVAPNIFTLMTDTVTPQGVLAIMKIQNRDEKDILDGINKQESFIILDKVQDPGNMGTIIRNCVAFNVKNIICAKGTVDVYSTKVVRSTMGGIYKVNVIYLDDDEIVSSIQKLKQNKYEIIGTDLKADKTLKEYNANRKTIFVMGNEANGVSKEIKDKVDTNIKIEMEDSQESLNVSIATGILLYNMYTNDKRT